MTNSFLKLSKDKLNSKRLQILRKAKEVSLNATNLVKRISEENSIPESTVWFNLRILDELDFLNFGNGFPVTLTFPGRLILKEIKGDEK